MDDLICQSRVLKERAQDLVEWKMITEMQLKSQIARVTKALERQRTLNSNLKEHLQMLDEEIDGLVHLTEAKPL